jgi:glycosyltransferase involved in cell wall biosynthesis
MKILHLVTLASSDGAGGGPLRVALNQALELSRRGHDVQLAAGWLGEGSPPTSIEGIPAHFFPIHRFVPRTGLSGIVSFRLTLWLIREVSAWDIVHIHAGRDLISTGSLVVARARRCRYVTQTHGMIQPDRRLRARIMDAVAVRRLLLRARVRFVLTQREMDGLAEVLGTRVPFERIFNGVPAENGLIRKRSDNEVLYCARLHVRKRPVAFVEMAGELRRRGIEANFSLVGPDEGELPAVQKAIEAGNLQDVVRYEGSLSYEAVRARMSQSGIYVLPSVHEPFPMSLLEALSLGLPSVCTDSCDISEILRDGRAALVTDGSVPAMADAVEAILKDEGLKSELTANARKVTRTIFSMEAVGDKLEQCYMMAQRNNVQ